MHIYNLLKNLQHKINLLTFFVVENERGVCKVKLKVHFVGCAIWSNLYQLSDRMVDWVPGGCPPLIWRSGEIIFLRIIKQPDMTGLFFFFFTTRKAKNFVSKNKCKVISRCPELATESSDLHQEGATVR